MLLIACLYCGERSELEFAYGGQVYIARFFRPSDTGEQEWIQFLYLCDNNKGLYAERWRYSHGCGKFFNAVRDIMIDHFVSIYKVGECS